MKSPLMLRASMLALLGFTLGCKSTAAQQFIGDHGPVGKKCSRLESRSSNCGVPL